MPDTAAAGAITADQLRDWGALAAAFIVGAFGYFRPKKPGSDGDARAVSTAMASPLGDPNQLRQVVEELHKLNDQAFHLTGLAGDIKDRLGDVKDGQREIRDAINRQASR